MLKLNRVASKLMREVGVNAATDITGYGLIGHIMEIVEKSGVQIRLSARTVPLLEGAQRYAREGRLPGGGGRNVAYYMSLASPSVTIEADIPQTLVELMFDPQTSGGLLISVPQKRAAQLEAAFQDANEQIWQIGTVEEGLGLVVTFA